MLLANTVVVLLPTILYVFAAWCRYIIGCYRSSGSATIKEYKRGVSLATGGCACIMYTHLSTWNGTDWNEEVAPVLIKLTGILRLDPGTVGFWVTIVSWVLHSCEPTNRWQIGLAQLTDTVAKLIYFCALSYHVGPEPTQISCTTFAFLWLAGFLATEAMFLFNPFSALRFATYDQWSMIHAAQQNWKKAGDAPPMEDHFKIAAEMALPLLATYTGVYKVYFNCMKTGE